MSRTRKVWTRQPQGVIRPNPEYALSSLVLPGQSRYDVVSGQVLSSASATPTRDVGPYGPQLKFDASQEAIYSTATALQKGSGAAASIVWVGELFAAPDAYASLGGITYDAANNNPYVFLEVKRNFASNNLFLSHSVGGSAANITNSGVYTTGWVVIVAAVTSGRQVMYSRSATVRERVSGTTSGSMSSTATSRLEIGESLNARNPQAACAMQAMSFVAWSDEQLLAILNDPWGQIIAPRTRKQRSPASAGGDPTAALSNNLATTASGILVPALSLATTGNSATASTGTLTPALSRAITGNAATASTGTPVASISLALTGNGATSSVGTVGIGGTTQALTGNAATASAGTPVAQISLALTGNASTASVGTAVPALSKALTGNAATTSAGTPTAALSLALAGNGATASAGTVAVPGVIVPSSNVATASSGTVSPGITVALTGNGVTASVGTVSPAIALALSGLAGTSSVGIVVPGLTRALTGNAATSAAGSVSVPTGDITLALSGNAATAAVGTVGVDQGSNSAWWTYTVAADNLTFTIPADDLTYSIDATTLAGAST